MPEQQDTSSSQTLSTLTRETLDERVGREMFVPGCARQDEHGRVLVPRYPPDIRCLIGDPERLLQDFRSERQTDDAPSLARRAGFFGGLPRENAGVVSYRAARRLEWQILGSLAAAALVLMAVLA